MVTHEAPFWTQGLGPPARRPGGKAPVEQGQERPRGGRVSRPPRARTRAVGHVVPAQLWLCRTSLRPPHWALFGRASTVPVTELRR
jgi:hypothetical protein